MPVKYIVLIVFIFVLFQLSLIPLQNSSLNSEAAYHLNVLSSWGIVQEEQTFGILKYAKAPFNYFDSLFTIATSSSSNPMFSGGFEIMRWIVLAPILAGVGFGLIIIFFGAFRRPV